MSDKFNLEDFNLLKDKTDDELIDYWCDAVIGYITRFKEKKYLINEHAKAQYAMNLIDKIILKRFK